MCRSPFTPSSYSRARARGQAPAKHSSKPQGIRSKCPPAPFWGYEQVAQRSGPKRSLNVPLPMTSCHRRLQPLSILFGVYPTVLRVVSRWNVRRGFVGREARLASAARLRPAIGSQPLMWFQRRQHPANNNRIRRRGKKN